MIRDEFIQLLNNSPLTVGEILYSVIVRTKAKTVQDIKSLTETEILAASEYERKAIHDKPMTDIEFTNWINKYDDDKHTN